MSAAMDHDDILLDLCERLGMLGLTRDACRIYQARDPFIASAMAAEVGWSSNDPKVKLVTKAIGALIVTGVAASADLFRAAMFTKRGA